MAEFFSILRASASDRRPFFVSLRGIIPVLVSLLAGCSNEPADVVYLGSTTSVYDTGLLDSLVVAFEQEHPDLEVRVLAVAPDRPWPWVAGEMLIWSWSMRPTRNSSSSRQGTGGIASPSCATTS